ncbi:MAG TPA: AAA family ATPase [Patescibacteria group bacterium]
MKTLRIALSGLSGAGSSTTAKLVAERLSLPMNNFTLRNLAVEKGLSFDEIHRLAKTDSSIDIELDRRLVRFIRTHHLCFVATDLACWLDQPSLLNVLGETEPLHFDYKIWLEVPLDERARRMRKREGGDISEIKTYNHARDLQNRERYIDLYGVDIFDHSKIDWVFQTEKLTLSQVVESLCERILSLENPTS